MKLLGGGFHQESNSFSSNYYGKNKFGVTRGEDIPRKYGAGAYTVIADFFPALEKLGVEVVPSVY